MDAGPILLPQRRGALAMLCLLCLIACGAAGSRAGGGGEAPAQAFDRFDHAGGTAFPPRARVTIGDVTVPPAAREAHVPVRLDRPTPNTVHLRVLTRNGSFPDGAYEGRHYLRTEAHLVFRPGDPLVQTVRVALKDLPQGTQFALHLPEGGDGADVADGVGVIRARAGASQGRARPEPPRAPLRFAPGGAPDYSLDPAAARWSDSGGAGVLRTRLPHGRTQPGNGETGLYLDPDSRIAGQPPVAVRGGALVLTSQQFPRPVPHEGRAFRHGAAVLTGERMPETHLAYGQIEWEAQMPSRRGSWPALWLLPARGGWPPEIDVYEGFGQSPDWNFAADISANLHGGPPGKRAFTVPMRIDARAIYGLSGFAQGYHRYALDIGPAHITWFVDGIEVYQAVNPFPGTVWFPLMTVAVKHEGAGDYAGGSGAMRVRAMRVWRADGPAGTPGGMR